jgi:hypothetical protein
MSRTTTRRRGLALAAVTTAAGLCLATTTILGGAAQSAEPTGDCTAAYPVADLVKGAPVTGLTVDHGTTPEAFTGEVVGVLADGIAPGLDMVMVKLSSPAIDEVGGIWQGMSGSPVYAGDGRLIGAVAYGLASGASPVAGVTPFEDMDDYLGSNAARTVPVGPAQARVIARHSDVSAAEASEGFTQLPMPLGISGVSARRVDQARSHADDHPYLASTGYALGHTAGATAPTADTIVAGGNVAGSLTYGDITMAGVGTATSVCQGRVVGFGHPLGFFGDTTLALHPADTLYVQKDLFAPFKVANIGDPVGTITDDRMTGITGTFGPLPDTAEVSSTVTAGTRTRTGLSHVSVRTADSLANAAFYQTVANHDRVIDGMSKGSEVFDWTITGTEDGVPFSLTHQDRYASSSDLTYTVGFDLGDMVYGLGGLDGVTIESITSGADFVDDYSSYRITSVQQYRHGAWVRVSKDKPAVVQAGHKLVARAVLVSGGQAITVPMSFSVPERAEGRRATLTLVGGNELYSYPNLRSIASAKRYLENLTRNDELQAVFGTSGGYYGGGSGDFYGRGDGSSGGGSAGGGGGGGFNKEKTLGPVDKVVGDYLRLKVEIR